MKPTLLVVCILCLFAGISLAEQTVEVNEVGKDKFEAAFPSGGELRLDLRSGDIMITGTDENKVRVHYEGSKAAETDDVRVRFKSSGNSGELNVSGGPRNNFRIVVEVPKMLDLYVRVFAGEMEIENITGNKDVELHAGELTVAIGNASDYGHLDASVGTGEVDVDPFGVEKGGLFRSFKKEGSGQYRLHAHVGAGQLTLR